MDADTQASSGHLPYPGTLRSKKILKNTPIYQVVLATHCDICHNKNSKLNQNADRESGLDL